MLKSILESMYSFFQITNPALTAETQGMQKWEFFQELVPNFVTLGLVAGSVLFFFVLLTGAIRWITAGANKQNVEAARNKIVQGFVGLVLMFFIFVIVRIGNLYLGVNIGNLGVPDSSGGGSYGSCTCVDGVQTGGECTDNAIPVCHGSQCACEQTDPSNLTCPDVYGNNYSCVQIAPVYSLNCASGTHASCASTGGLCGGGVGATTFGCCACLPD